MKTTLCRLEAMMSPENTLRVAVIITWGSLAAAVVVSFWEEATLALPLRDYLEAEYSKPFTEYEIVGLVLALGSIVASIGLLRLTSWARPLFLWTTVLLLCLWPAIGPEIMGPWTAIFNAISLMGFGAVITLTYFGKVKHRFQRRGP